MVKPGDIVRVKVLDVDIPRKRISLTLRLDDEHGKGAPATGGGERRGGSGGSGGSGGGRGPREGGGRSGAPRQRQGGGGQRGGDRRGGPRRRAGQRRDGRCPAAAGLLGTERGGR